MIWPAGVKTAIGSFHGTKKASARCCRNSTRFERWAKFSKFALREIDQGKIDDAVKTMRLGYEMANKVGEKGVLVCGLISMSISLQMNECLEQLMNRPDAPNLYWALE